MYTWTIRGSCAKHYVVFVTLEQDSGCLFTCDSSAASDQPVTSCNTCNSNDSPATEAIVTVAESLHAIVPRMLYGILHAVGNTQQVDQRHVEEDEIRFKAATPCDLPATLIAQTLGLRHQARLADPASPETSTTWLLPWATWDSQPSSAANCGARPMKAVER